MTNSTIIAVSETSPVVPRLPAVQCAPWCADGNGHANATHPLDQYCFSKERTVALIREDLIEGWTAGSLALDYLRGYLVLERFEAEAHIITARGDAAGPSMTLDEAAAWAHALLRLVETAQGASV
jgi:hypothetical protein